MTGFLKIGSPEYPCNPILITGIGINEYAAVNYLKKVGIAGVDFTVLSKGIVNKDLKKYKIVFIIGDSTELQFFELTSYLSAATKELDILTIVVFALSDQEINNPNSNRHMAELGILKSKVDSIILIPENKSTGYHIHSLPDELTKKADWMTFCAINIIYQLATGPRYVSVDFYEVYSAMHCSGFGHIITGSASGDKRAENAVKMAFPTFSISPQQLRIAKNILMLVSGPDDVTTDEIADIVDNISNLTDGNLIFDFQYFADATDDITIMLICTELFDF